MTRTHRETRFALRRCRVFLFLFAAPNAPAATLLVPSEYETIDPFVILVHPCPYEGMGRDDSDPYRALERVVCERWFDSISSLPKSAFAIQVDFSSEGPSPNRLHKRFIDHLGPGRVCRIPCEVVSPEDPDDLKDYYSRIHDRILRKIESGRFSFDASKCKTVIWGQSFEGCASGFGSAIAHSLGLQTPTELDPRMSVPDAPFLLEAELLKSVWTPDSDIQAYLFDLRDGRCAAFFRSALTPQWLDRRPIELRLEPEHDSILTKQGEVVWPEGVQPTDDQKKNSRFNQWRSLGWLDRRVSPESETFSLATLQERFVVSSIDHLTRLASIIESAVVHPENP